LQHAHHNKHGDSYTTCCKGSAYQGYDSGDLDCPSSSDVVGDWTANERANDSSEEEQGIYCTKDRVRVV
jgi:hypothetical protein